MPHPPRQASSPSLSDNQIDELQRLLDAIPPPFEPLDVSSLDGFLVGVLLQQPVLLPTQWLPFVTDIEGREQGTVDATLKALVLRRHAELDLAIERRDWFDPWIFELDEDSPPSEAVLGWVAGFAAAMDLFPGLMQRESHETLEPLAQLYAHLDPEDLEDADDLLAMIETLEPPRDLPEAVESLVRSTLLLADVTRPVTPRAPRRPGSRTPKPGRR